MSPDSDGYLLAEIVESNVHGTITIAPGVLIELIEFAASAVEGVTRIVPTRRVIRGKAHAISDGAETSASGSWHAERGIRVRIVEGAVDASLAVAVQAGTSVPNVAADIQEHVATVVEKMLGLKTGPIDVHIVEIRPESVPA